MAIDPIIEAAFGPPPENIDLDQSRVMTNTVIATVLLIVAAVAVILRLWVRRIKGAELGPDDWAIIAGLFFNAGSAGMVIPTDAYGSGQHVWAISSLQLVTAAKILFFYTFVLGFCVSFNKLSVLLFFNRLFSFGGAKGTCTVDTGTFFWTYGALNAFFDFLILFLPILSILRLQMSSKKKAAVCGIMLLGSFVCVTGVVRTLYMYRFAHSVDITWLMGEICVWSSIEPSVGIVSACLPSLGPLLVKLRERVMSQPSSRTYVTHESQGRRGGHWGQRGSAGLNFKSILSPRSKEDDEIQLHHISQTSSDTVHR
ncbi:Uu.00g074030.m01.CDS01 [Anthostomella pinea]|uniref:Uu.00g074030.m01.CDS01 n=1 Tax=Anthostomella pinea TaxID=933095 RepID=A0AAI8YNZ5_9PEZI|nr:Uu.00g074030.m01.CDS01 [Anthostomella pinea]